MKIKKRVLLMRDRQEDSEDTLIRGRYPFPTPPIIHSSYHTLKYNCNKFLKSNNVYICLCLRVFISSCDLFIHSDNISF